MDNLFGHQSEILMSDCLRKERLLTVGRDRTMRLWKVKLLVLRTAKKLLYQNDLLLLGNVELSQIWRIMF